MQGSVQQSGVQSVLGGVAPCALGEFDLCVQLVTCPPGGTEPLEHRAVPEARLRGSGVEVGEVDGLAAGGRPGGQVVRCPGRGGGVGGQEAGGVSYPGLVVAFRSGFGAGVDLDRAGAVVLRCADADLEVHSAVAGQDQGGFEGQFVEPEATGLLARVQRELDERGAREDDLAVHGVVGQPGVRARGEAAGEQYA